MKKLLLFLVILCLGFTSCEDFLSEKPDVALRHPENLSDLDALLNNYLELNCTFSGLGYSTVEDFEVLASDYLVRPIDDQAFFRWDHDEIENSNLVGINWSFLYRGILYCNVVLEYLDKLKSNDLAFRNRLEGDALFSRSFRYFDLVSIFCPPYLVGDKDFEYGLAPKKTSNTNETIKRISIIDSYNLIIDDLKKAAELLPVELKLSNRPSRPAAYALLARIYLAIGDYKNALTYADKCLTLKSDLIDYNLVNPNLAFSFLPLNKEIIYHAISNQVNSLTSPLVGDVSKELLNLYSDEDCRKEIFFIPKNPQRMRFKGAYQGSHEVMFAGLSVNEIIMIKAECQIRVESVGKGMETLNNFLRFRYRNGYFKPLSAKNENSALQLLFIEKRKELPYRSLRWLDLRRLNRDVRFATTLKRSFPDGKGNFLESYLPPNDKRYCFPIPSRVIERVGIKQNP